MFIPIIRTFLFSKITYLFICFCHIDAAFDSNCNIVVTILWGVLQRERAASLRLSDVGRFFHLPIDEAARKLKLCPTVVKKICRREEMNRWPYRKVKFGPRR